MQKLFAVLSASGLAAELASPEVRIKEYSMPRKKAADQESLLTRNLIVRVSEETFLKLEKMRLDSKQPSVAEVVRIILTNRKLKLFHKDVSMDGPMEELALIYKELRATGHNINQITKSFHQHKLDTHRMFFAGKAAQQYKLVGDKVEQLLEIVSKLSNKWLHES